MREAGCQSSDSEALLAAVESDGSTEGIPSEVHAEFWQWLVDTLETLPAPLLGAIIATCSAARGGSPTGIW